MMHLGLVLAGAVGLAACATSEPAPAKLDGLRAESATCMAAVEYLRKLETPGSDRDKALKIAAAVADMGMTVLGPSPSELETLREQGRQTVAAKVAGKSPTEATEVLNPIVVDCMPKADARTAAGGAHG